MRIWIACSIISIFFAVSANAQADPIVVILSSGNDPHQTIFSRQLDAELRAMGFSPRTIPQDTPDFNPETLDEVARTHEAVAAITLRGSADRPVIWIADRATGKLLRRELDEKPGAASDVLAVRAVELLRASLIELEATHSVKSEMEPEPKVLELAAESIRPENRAGSIRMAISAGALLTPGEMSQAGMGLLDWSFVPKRWLGVSLLITFPITVSRTTGDGGEVKLWSGVAGLGLRLKVLKPSDPWNVDFTLGAGGQLAIAEGTPVEGYSGDTAIERSFTPWLQFSVSRRVQRVISIRADALVGVALPPIEIKTATKTVPFGMPWFGLTLGLDFGR
jgi:hypothetical protein